MNWQSFISLIQNKTDNTFFLSNARQHRVIGQIISALLNTNGGKLIIGYDKVNVHLTGYEQTDQWIDEFIDNHFRNTLITSTFLFRSNKKILILEIEKNQIDMSFSGKFYKLNEKEIIEYTPIIQAPTVATSYETQTNIPQQNNIQNIPFNHEKIKPPHNSNATESINIPTKQTIEIPSINALDDETSIEPSDKFNTRQLKALDFITKQGSIKNKQYRKLFSVSHKTAHIELAELVQKKKLMIVGSGRSTCYRLPGLNQQNNKIDSISVNEAVIPKNLLESFLAQHTQITESMYADEFNMDLAQAINELQFYCEEGFIEKTLIDNNVCYIKAKQLSFIQ